MSFDDLDDHLGSVCLHDLLAIFWSPQSHGGYGQAAGVADATVSLKENYSLKLIYDSIYINLSMWIGIIRTKIRTPKKLNLELNHFTEHRSAKTFVNYLVPSFIFDDVHLFLHSS